MTKYTLIILLSFLILIPQHLSADEHSIYMCPMHPHITNTELGHTCPICGMDLVEKIINDNSSQDTSSITLPESMVQNSAIRTQKVIMQEITKTIRAYGILSNNERKQSDIVSRVEGWIAQLNITSVGDTVEKGDLLYKIHSPDLTLAQREYLRAFKSGKTLASKSSHKLFTHYELDDSVIEQIERKGKPIKNVPFYAKRDGTISEINLSEGAYIKLDSIIARMQDYSTLWLKASIAEKDLPVLSMGKSGNIKLPHNNKDSFKATIDHIHPAINPLTRTGTVRLLVENKDKTLKIGSYADVTFNTIPRFAMTVPREAILRDSQGTRVVLSLPDNKFSVRKVTTGDTFGNSIEILKGIQIGDIIVSSGQFLIDSESSMQEALQKLTNGNSGGAHAGH